MNVTQLVLSYIIYFWQSFNHGYCMELKF